MLFLLVKGNGALQELTIEYVSENAVLLTVSVEMLSNFVINKKKNSCKDRMEHKKFHLQETTDLAFIKSLKTHIIANK